MTCLAPAERCLPAAFAVGKSTGRFDHHVDVQRFPRQFFWIFDREYFDGVSINENLVLLGLNSRRQRAVHRVVFEQVGERLGVREIVDSDDLQVFVTHRGAQHVAPDASESIDSYSNGHSVILYINEWVQCNQVLRWNSE